MDNAPCGNTDCDILLEKLNSNYKRTRYTK